MLTGVMRGRTFKNEKPLVGDVLGGPRATRGSIPISTFALCDLNLITFQYLYLWTPEIPESVKEFHNFCDPLGL